MEALAKTENAEVINVPMDLMQAAVLVAPGNIDIGQYKLPHPANDEVRIKLQGSGVCASNLPMWEGREWFTYPVSAGEPGHEGWGIIDAVGKNVEELKVGDRVTAISYKTYATHDIAAESSVVKLPEFLDDHPFPGEPLACAMNIFSRSKIEKGQTVAIVGIGFLGALLVQMCKAAGARVIAISRREFSRKIAKDHGADKVLELKDHGKIINEVEKYTAGQFCECVIEATGKEWPLNLSVELTAERGKLIVAGFHQDGMRSVNMQLLNWRGIDMINAHERDVRQYVEGIRKAIRAVQNGEINPFPLFTHHFKLEEIEQAFWHLANRPEGFVKAIIKY